LTVVEAINIEGQYLLFLIIVLVSERFVLVTFVHYLENQMRVQMS
jgi:hypothetical protein